MGLQDGKAMVSVQPFAQPPPSAWHSAPDPSSQQSPQRDLAGQQRKSGLRGWLQHLTTKDAWIGEYDFATLCMPRFCPWRRPKAGDSGSPFFGLHDQLPIGIASVAGLQLALAMAGGLAVPPMLIASAVALPSEMQSYWISASFISSGILSAVQMSAIPLPWGRQLGTGLISVVGTSFATLSTATAIINNLYADGTCETLDGVKQSCPTAIGFILGTSAVTALLQVFLSMLPPRVLRRIFPPIITGPVILLIGMQLIGESALPSFGGGSACYDDTTQLCPLPRAYMWGDRRYLGLGFLSFMVIVAIEIFGSPMMRNSSIVLGLALPCIVAGPLGYTDGDNIKAARAITFLWVETFPLKVYGPAVLPLLAVGIALISEAAGDIAATSEVSRVEVEGPAFDKRVSGGILADGLGCILAPLFTTTSISVYAQTNAVVASTRCANVKAGRWCSFWLILFGVLGKISGVILSIPQPILGGVQLYLFAAIMVSGLRVVSMVKFTRRTRFVLTVALSWGMVGIVAQNLWSHLFTYMGSNKALKGFFDSIVILLSTSSSIAALAGIAANLILPMEVEDLSSDGDSYRDEEATGSSEKMPIASSAPTGT